MNPNNEVQHRSLWRDLLFLIIHNCPILMTVMESFFHPVQSPLVVEEWSCHKAADNSFSTQEMV